MSDYRYGDVISMQEAAIRRVNEMQRRAREAARLANEELSGGTAKNFQQSGERRESRSASAPAKTAGHTNLPVDYLHGGYPKGYSGGHYSQNNDNFSGNKAYTSDEKESEVFHSVPTDSGKNHPSPPKNQNSQHNGSKQKSTENEKNNKSSSSGNHKANQNSWAQAAVNRQQKQNIQNPPHRENNMPQRQMPHVQRNNQLPFSFGDNGIFSALGGIAGKMDNDTMLLLGLMYILWRDGADYGLLFALFYILM